MGVPVSREGLPAATRLAPAGLALRPGIRPAGGISAAVSCSATAASRKEAGKWPGCSRVLKRGARVFK